MSRRSRIGMAVIALLALPWVLDQLVVTDQERVEDLFRGLAEAGSQKDLDRALTHLTEDFECTAARLRAATPADFRDRVERAWRGMDEVRLTFESVTIQGERPAVEAEVTGWLMLRGGGLRGGGTLKAHCELVWEADGPWRVSAVRSLEFSGGF